MQLQRSAIELEVNLPFVWIDAAARDDVSKENLVHSAILRNDMKYKRLF